MNQNLQVRPLFFRTIYLHHSQFHTHYLHGMGALPLLGVALAAAVDNQHLIPAVADFCNRKSIIQGKMCGQFP